MCACVELKHWARVSRLNQGTLNRQPTVECRHTLNARTHTWTQTHVYAASTMGSQQHNQLKAIYLSHYYVIFFKFSLSRCLCLSLCLGSESIVFNTRNEKDIVLIFINGNQIFRAHLCEFRRCSIAADCFSVFFFLFFLERIENTGTAIVWGS